MRKPKYGFYNPPPMLIRYPRKSEAGGGIYSTLSSRSTNTQSRQYQYSHQPTAPASLAMSQQTMDSHRTATSTML